MGAVSPWSDSASAFSARCLGELLRASLFEVSAFDPLTLASIAAGVFLTVLAASAIPARRASRIDPTIALRG